MIIRAESGKIGCSYGDTHKMQQNIDEERRYFDKQYKIWSQQTNKKTRHPIDDNKSFQHIKGIKDDTNRWK